MDVGPAREARAGEHQPQSHRQPRKNDLDHLSFLTDAAPEAQPSDPNLN